MLHCWRKLRHSDLLRYLTMPLAILDYNQHSLCSRIGDEEDSSISSFTSHKLVISQKDDLVSVH